jgi:arginine exporter protein ArgO
MREVVVSGLVTGWAIAVPIGAVGTFLVTLTARAGWRAGAAGALGIATVDGAYAAVAVAAGSAVAAALEPVAAALRVVSAVVLLGLAALTLAHALATVHRAREPVRLRPPAAYLLFVGITAVNPTTVVYFAAVVLGNHQLVAGAAEGVVFVLAAFAASASWQLLLAASGAALGRSLDRSSGGPLAGRRAHVLTGVVSSVVIAALAVRTMLG